MKRRAISFSEEQSAKKKKDAAMVELADSLFNDTSPASNLQELCLKVAPLLLTPRLLKTPPLLPEAASESRFSPVNEPEDGSRRYCCH